MEQLNKHLIDVEPEGFIVGGEDNHSCGVTVAAGQGELKKGSILAIGEDGKTVLLGFAPEAEEGKEAPSYKAAYILREDVDATNEDVVAIAFDRATAIKQLVKVAEDYELTNEDIDSLRIHNIFLEDQIQ